MSVDRLQRSFLPVTGEAESRTTVALLTDAGVIADQGTPSDDTEALVQNLDAEIAESVAGKRLSLAYEDSGGNERQGVLLPVEYPGAGWAVAVTGSSPTTYGPNRTLLRDGLIALAIAVAATLLLAVIFAADRQADPKAQSQAGSSPEAISTSRLTRLARARLRRSVNRRNMAGRLTSEVRDAETARGEMALQNDVMRELLRRTVRMQEDERRRIAADIHDAVSPLITGALYRVRALIMRENGAHGSSVNGDDVESHDGLGTTAELLDIRWMSFTT